VQSGRWLMARELHDADHHLPHDSLDHRVAVLGLREKSWNGDRVSVIVTG
jgi:hypothetical protein